MSTASHMLPNPLYKMLQKSALKKQLRHTQLNLRPLTKFFHNSQTAVISSYYLNKYTLRHVMRTNLYVKQSFMTLILSLSRNVELVICSLASIYLYKECRTCHLYIWFNLFLQRMQNLLFVHFGKSVSTVYIMIFLCISISPY